MSKMRFLERKLHFLFFFFPFYVGEIETTKKNKMEKAQKKYKNCVFLGGHPKM